MFLHPGSVYSNENEHTHLYLVYFEKAMTSQLYIRDATFANPYSILVRPSSQPCVAQHHARIFLAGSTLLAGWLAEWVDACAVAHGSRSAAIRGGHHSAA